MFCLKSLTSNFLNIYKTKSNYNSLTINKLIYNSYFNKLYDINFKLTRPIITYNLAAAAKNNHRELVDYFIKLCKEKKIILTNNEYSMAIVYAMFGNNYSLVKYLTSLRKINTNIDLKYANS